MSGYVRLIEDGGEELYRLPAAGGTLAIPLNAGSVTIVMDDAEDSAFARLGAVLPHRLEMLRTAADQSDWPAVAGDLLSEDPDRLAKHLPPHCVALARDPKEGP